MEDKSIILDYGKPGEWDDYGLWTGSVIEKYEKFYLFYTGVNEKEKGKIQRIDLAISDDLI